LEVNDRWIEAGDLANEIGKIYIQDLDSAIEDGRKYNKKILYFVIMTEKNPTDLQEINIKIGITDKFFPELKESMDFWKYDYKTEEKTLLWSVPSRIDMKNFLRAEHRYSKDIIKWIKKFLKQHPEIDLKDSSAVRLK